MFLRPKSYFTKLLFVLFVAVFSLTSATFAQTKKKPQSKPTAVKKPQTTAKDAKKDSRSKNETATAKSKNDKKSDKKDSKKSKETAKAKDAKDSKDKNSKKAREDATRLAAKQREEAKRRAEEEARRQQAILAEKRRREQIRREQIARALAFERGLRTKTVENIAGDDTTGEDLAIRNAAINALGSKAGTVVVMEAQTGKILTIVNQDWAIREAYRPCSTIKLVTGVAGINERVINSAGGIGNYRYNLDDALAFSDNAYFQRVGVNMGNDTVISYARVLGLGEKTGINADNEASGKLPYNNKSALIYSHGDDFAVSPLQLAVMVSAISNGGKIVVPQTPRTRQEQTNFRGYLRHQISVPPSSLTGVIPGMIGAAQYGTAKRGVSHSLGIAGKTGSCKDKGSWLGLFTSVAPIQNPKYAVVVITRGNGERGSKAAAVAGSVYNALAERMRTRENKNLALIPVNLKPKSQITAKTPIIIKDEDDETDEEENVDFTEADTPKNQVIVGKTPPQPKQKEKNVEEKFPPVVIKVKRPEGEHTRPRVVPNE